MLMLACVRDDDEAVAALAAGFDGTVGGGAGSSPVGTWEREAAGQVLRLEGGRRAERFLSVETGLPAADALARLAAAGWTGVLVRHDARLLDVVALPSLAALTARAHAAGLRIACAGGLEGADVSRLRGCGVDALLFGRALREGERLAAGRLRAVAALAGQPLLAAVVPAPTDRRDRIFVHDLVCAMQVGAYASERNRAQRVRFDIEADLADRVMGAPTLDAIVSYDLITDAVARLTTGRHVELVETLAEEVAAAILAEPRVARVRVRVAKLDLGPGAVGIEVERCRAGEAP